MPNSYFTEEFSIEVMSQMPALGRFAAEAGNFKAGNSTETAVAALRHSGPDSRFCNSIDSCQ